MFAPVWPLVGFALVLLFCCYVAAGIFSDHRSGRGWWCEKRSRTPETLRGRNARQWREVMRFLGAR